MVVHVVAQSLNVSQGELIVADLGFLQADHVRLVFFDQRGQLVRAGPQTIDVETDDLHGKTIPVKGRMLADIVPDHQRGGFAKALLTCTQGGNDAPWGSSKALYAHSRRTARNARSHCRPGSHLHTR
ncbi:hypothetical protein D3C73_1362410 [compost metagenome]